nr:Gag-Pol polyprotein [Tanacetum cinerariifolium]
MDLEQNQNYGMLLLLFSCRDSRERKGEEIIRIEESLNVTFDESFPDPKSSLSVEDYRINEPVVQDLNGSLSLQVNVSDEGYPKNTNQEKLYLLHMDLCGPMRVKSVNGKKYILVIVDDYSRFTWVKCLRLASPMKHLLLALLKVIATACFTQNRSIIHLHHDKTPYKLLHDKLPDLSYFHVFGALCYPTNDNENLGKLQPKADIAPEVIALITEVVAPEHTGSTGSPSSTTVDQDAPSPSNDPLFGILIQEVSSDQSSSTDSIHKITQPDHQISEGNSKWTKDHPLENITGQLARPVSTRLQLHEQALFCYYDAFLISVEPKTYKDALTQSCWIEAMQEELN